MDPDSDMDRNTGCHSLLSGFKLIPVKVFFLIADPDPAVFLGVNRDLKLKFLQL
jgi:hypothetical protein